MSDDKPIPSPPIVLERQRVSRAFYVSANARLEKDRFDYELRAQKYRLESEVLAERLGSATHETTVGYDFPASPWQFFKQRHAEAWWLRWLVERWPVITRKHFKHVTVTGTRYATYPEATYLPPDTFGHPVLMDTTQIEIEETSP